MEVEPYNAYYFDGGEIRLGVVVRETQPGDPKTGQVLYEFGHGLSTTEIYKSKKEAEASLEDKQNEKVPVGSDSASV